MSEFKERELVQRSEQVPAKRGDPPNVWDQFLSGLKSVAQAPFFATRFFQAKVEQEEAKADGMRLDNAIKRMDAARRDYEQVVDAEYTEKREESQGVRQDALPPARVKELRGQLESPEEPDDARATLKAAIERIKMAGGHVEFELPEETDDGELDGEDEAE